MHPILASLSYHILVVKNELDLYEMIRRALECDRFHDTFAAKKTTAILLLSSLKIDIVLVDVRLPTVSAPRWRNTGVVENTGHIDDRASRHITEFDQKGIGYIEKPFRLEQLRQEVRDRLAKADRV
jgi:DNA-binding response OmpR family regulator